MKEILFLKRNAQKWRSIEKLLSKKVKDYDKLANLFIELTDDLSYARTHYPESRTVIYLNELTALIHQKIYKNKREPAGKLMSFWKVKLPILLFTYRKEMAVSLTIFILSILIGVISQHYDRTFANLVLGDSYVSTTIENIENGEPLGVYQNNSQFLDFLGFAIHNTTVAYLTFILGIVFGVGSVFMLFYNGIILGSFFYLFYQYGALEQAMYGVWLHGTLEIWAIVIGGMAGLVMGNGLLFPHTFTRSVSFINAAKNGLKIVVGVTPLFIVAGFVEAFITMDFSHMSNWENITIILIFITSIIAYFIIFPAMQHLKTNGDSLKKYFTQASLVFLSVTVMILFSGLTVFGFDSFGLIIFTAYFFCWALGCGIMVLTNNAKVNEAK